MKKERRVNYKFLGLLIIGGIESIALVSFIIMSFMNIALTQMFTYGFCAVITLVILLATQDEINKEIKKYSN